MAPFNNCKHIFMKRAIKLVESLMTVRIIPEKLGGRHWKCRLYPLFRVVRSQGSDVEFSQQCRCSAVKRPTASPGNSGVWVSALLTCEEALTWPSLMVAGKRAA